MNTRRSHRTPTFCALALLALLCATAFAQRGYGPNMNRNGTGFRGDVVQRTPDYVMMYEGQGTVMAGGHRRLALALTPIAGGATVRALVPNKEKSEEPSPEYLEKIKNLTPGESLVRVELERMYGGAQLKSLYVIQLKPGEKTPNAFVFSERYDDPNTRIPVVVLTKYGERVETTIAPVRDEKGKFAPDSKVSDELDKLKEGDVIYAMIMPGRTPMITAVYPYKDPQPGKMVKMTEQEMDGRKAPAVEIDANGSKVTALIPGKLVNKRWVPDQNVYREARATRPNTDVLFVTHDEDGKTVLTMMYKAPPAPKEPAAASGRQGHEPTLGK